MKKQNERALMVMTTVILASLAIVLNACRTNNKKNAETSPKIGKVQYASDADANYATYYVIVADTSLDYKFLHDKMFALKRELNISIDTMGRYFNKDKNQIVLPENDKDEMYAGQYFPRRDPSANLSLEYFGVYSDKSGENTIALVAGIYETQKSADSALIVLKNKEKKTFKVKANIFIGCMH